MNDIKVNDLLSQLKAMSALAQGQPPVAPAAGGADFASMLKGGVEAVNNTQNSAQKLVTAFETGDKSVDLAEVMVAMQKASISFQAMTQVRNKLVSAYQEIMSMNI